jgi:superfamily II DNA or RNA helicase
MSIKVRLDALTRKQKAKIDREVVAYPKETDYCANPDPIYPYDIDEEHVFLPYWYASQKLGLESPDPETKGQIDYEFEGELRDYQESLCDEIISSLEDTGTCVVSMHVGAGKCLGKDTEVFLESGEVVKAQDVKVGDTLLGDKTNNTVIGVCRGVGKLYTVKTCDSEYVVNSDHILTLYDTSTQELVDIPIEDYLHDPYRSDKYRGFRVKKLLKYGWTEDSSFMRQSIADRYKFVIRSVGGVAAKVSGHPTVLLPTIKSKCGVEGWAYEVDAKLRGIGEYYGFELDGNGRFILGDFSLTHNTPTSLYISTVIGLKTLIVVCIIDSVEMWTASIQRFVPGATIQYLESKTVVDAEADYYIVNAINMPKIGRQVSNVGLLVADECHLLCAEKLSEVYYYVEPCFCLALSGTPMRYDGLFTINELVFGKREVTKKLDRHHIIYKFRTGFTPSYEMQANGRMNWGTLLDSQANNYTRNSVIADTICYFADRRFIVLVKRVAQGETLRDLLLERGETVTTLLRNQKKYDKKARILIGTTKKCGTAFDNPSLDTLLLAGDVEAYAIQYFGRVMRSDDVNSIIITFVDKHSSLEKHFRTIRDASVEHGGEAKDFNETFPELTARLLSPSVKKEWAVASKKPERKYPSKTLGRRLLLKK